MRTKPVSRDEVRVVDWHTSPWIATYPVGSFRRKSQEPFDFDEVPIKRLWVGLVRRLRREHKAYIASEEYRRREDARRLALGKHYTPSSLDPPEMPGAKFYRYERRRVCKVCGKDFYAASRYVRAPYCSDKCMESARAERQRADRAVQVAKRAKKRAAARANRECPMCQELLPAQRSTKRFCSTKCRVAAHRAGVRGVSIGAGLLATAPAPNSFHCS